MNAKEFLQNLFLQGLDACSPSRAVTDAMRIEGNRLTVKDEAFDLENVPVYLFSVGKAGVPMFESANKILNKEVKESLVITSDKDEAESCGADEVVAGSHPLPDEQSLEAGKKAVSFFERIPKGVLLINLISGGTSSLMCLPPENISFTDINTTYELLNNSGATIRDINTVRKHCSQIKGGQLLGYINPEVTVIDLVISDVPDDDISIIGSGPTTPEWSNFQDTYHILLEYELWDRLPESVQLHIEKGIEGEEMDTLKPGQERLRGHSQHIISSAGKLATTIADLATGHVTSVHCATAAFNDDVETMASNIFGDITKSRDGLCLYIYFGESTVEVTGQGTGGRNQELALRGALKISGYKNITWLSAGTDGIDGPTDAAGAVVDGNTIAEAREMGIDPKKHLANNDSYHFHQQAGTLLKTGATGNNLMDIVLILVGN